MTDGEDAEPGEPGAAETDSASSAEDPGVVVTLSGGGLAFHAEADHVVRDPQAVFENQGAVSIQGLSDASPHETTSAAPGEASEVDAVLAGSW